MSYKYITENNLKNTQNYMYSEYGGYDFLKEYIDERKKFANQYSSCDVKLEDLAYQENNTAIDLYKIYIALINGEDGYIGVLDGYLKSFEVRKRLYFGYIQNTFKPLDEDDYGNLSSYIIFSLCVYEAYKITNSLKYLNCLLKVNDTLMSMENEMNDCEKSVTSLCLYNEIYAYEKIARDIVEVL